MLLVAGQALCRQEEEDVKVSAFMKQRRKVIKNQKTVLGQSVIDSAVWGDRGRLAPEEAESRLLNAQQFSHNR